MGGLLTSMDPQALIPKLDLSSCDREPIHTPGRVQAHGALFVMGLDGRVRHVSANVETLLGIDPQRALNRPISESFPAEIAEALFAASEHPTLEDNPVHIRTVALPTPAGRREFLLIAHRRKGKLVVELEPAVAQDHVLFNDRYADVGVLLHKLQDAKTLADMCRVVAVEIRRITGFDRVLIYQFDDVWNGMVVAEDSNGRLPSLLNHRFPAADIPAQARELYRLNRLRLISDRDASTSPLVPDTDPETGAPVDLSFATLRSVSPVHIEYMRNMGTAASMSASILRDGKLWGLISCHNERPKPVSFDVRAACDFVARLLTLQLPALEHNEEMVRRIELKSLQSKLLSAMAGEAYFIDGLTKHPEDLLNLAGATGAAVLFNDGCTLVGDTPSEPDVREIAEWLDRRSVRGVYVTDRLAEDFHPARRFLRQAAGVAAVSISRIDRSFVLWFRPEVVQTIKWGGDPRKPVDMNASAQRINPRKSFETWLETVRERAMPWSHAEVEAITELRASVVNIVLEKAEELAKLSAELRRSNQELEAFSYSVSHDLRAPFRHIVGYGNLLQEEEAKNLSPEGQRWIKTILESAEYAGTLVDNLLGLSRIGRAALHMTSVDMTAVAQQVQRELQRDAGGRNVTWKIGEMPEVQGDLVLLRLVFQNLMSNALKFTKPRQNAIIEVNYRDDDQEYVFFVRDNGVGFDMQYVDKLFGVFQRLHRVEDFEGTGIGLATVRRVISRHGGRAWAEGALNEGATMFFTLPKPLGDENA